MDGTAKLQLVE